MGHKTLVGGTAYEIKGGRTLVNGTGYKISKGRTLVGGTGYDIIFGTPIGELAAGTSVYMNVNGVPKEFIIVNQGLPSSSYDSSCNGTWLLMKDIYEKAVWHTARKNNYETSYVHTTYLPTLLNKFDSDVQNAIIQAKIPYYNRNSDKTMSGANGLSTKLFLLSMYELGYSKNSTTSSLSNLYVDGAKLQYFTESNNQRRIAYLNGTASTWWTRSPYSVDNVMRIGTSGTYVNFAEIPTSSLGVRPALILNSDTLVNPDDHTIIA